MNRPLLLMPEGGGPRLRAIGAGDLEDLRTWKNRDRQYFFFREIISPEQQARWFAGYLDRPDDYMFVAEAPRQPDEPPFGCMGLRLVGEYVDVYNVIRGRRLEGEGVRMADAFALMCSFALSFERAITLMVLKDNPAVAWYERRGFARVEERPDHYFMRLDPRSFVPVRYAVMKAVP